jgi:hypothetical protein
LSSVAGKRHEGYVYLGCALQLLDGDLRNARGKAGDGQFARVTASRLDKIAEVDTVMRY